MIKIKQHKFKDKKVKKVANMTAVREQDNKIKQLQFGIQGVEQQLKRLIRLAENLEFIEEENESSNNTKEIITYDKNKMNNLKKYLKWVLNILKDKRWLKQADVGDDQYLDNYFIQNFNDIEKMLTQDISYKISSSLSLRNRAGRAAEHVGTKPTIFDYGTFIEETLIFHDCFVYGSGYYFGPQKLIEYIKQDNPSFISKVIMTVLNLHRISLPGYNFKELIDYILHNIAILVPQFCNNVSIENLKALVLLHDIAFTLNNPSLSHRLLCMALRMAYSLRIDKIQLDNQSKLLPYEEYKQLVELKKLWIELSLGASYSSNSNELPSIMTCYIATESELDNFNYINNLEISNTNNLGVNHNSCKGIFNHIIAQSSRMFTTILDHARFNIPKQDNPNHVSYSQICLPEDKYNKLQVFINNYISTPPSFIYDEIQRQSRNEPIIIERYICKITKNYICMFKVIHEIRISLYFYGNQINLNYPIVLKTPYQVDIPLNKLIVILEAALKLLALYKAIVYIYFEIILEQMEPCSNLELDIYYRLKNYLDGRPRPIIQGKKEYYYYMIRSYTFMNPYSAFCVLLQTLSSKVYFISELANHESVKFIKYNIFELLEIYKIAYKLKDPFLRIDIDIVVDRVKQVVKNFNILEKYQIDWEVLLKEFEL